MNQNPWGTRERGQRGGRERMARRRKDTAFEERNESVTEIIVT